MHANQYYQLELEIFSSSLDKELLGLLWNKYWVNTLSQSPLISVRECAQLVRLLLTCVPTEPRVRRIATLGPAGQAVQGDVLRGELSGPAAEHGKLAGQERQGTSALFDGPLHSQREQEKEPKPDDKKKKVEESQLSKSVKDSAKIASEAQHGLISQVLKDIIFSTRPGQQASLDAVVGSAAATEDTAMVLS